MNDCKIEGNMFQSFSNQPRTITFVLCSNSTQHITVKLDNQQFIHACLRKIVQRVYERMQPTRIANSNRIHIIRPPAKRNLDLVKRVHCFGGGTSRSSNRPDVRQKLPSVIKYVQLGNLRTIEVEMGNASRNGEFPWIFQPCLMNDLAHCPCSTWLSACGGLPRPVG